MEKKSFTDVSTESDLSPILESEGEERALATQHASLMEEISTLKDQLLRALAEADNIRKRATREQDDARKYAITQFSRELLSVADNLGRALESIPPEASADTPLLKTIIDGVTMTQSALLNILERHGIQKIPALGEKFDPHLHQAMMEVEGPPEKAGTVIQVLQEGYQIQDRLLRPAMVMVGKTAAPPA